MHNPVVRFKNQVSFREVVLPLIRLGSDAELSLPFELNLKTASVELLSV